MNTERRALNGEERASLFSSQAWFVDWKELVFLSIFNGAFAGAIVSLVLGVCIWSIGIKFTDLAGLDREYLVLAFAVAGAVLMLAYMIWFEVGSQRRIAQRRKEVLEREDLIVELHKLADCMLIRDPEHGQCMFFVRTTDNKIIFVFEGQDELDERWEKNPLYLTDTESPKSELKVIRIPETKESVLVEFLGEDFPITTCYMISLDARFWPQSGKIIRPPWDDLQKRYRLKRLITEA